MSLLLFPTPRKISRRFLVLLLSFYFILSMFFFCCFISLQFYIHFSFFSFLKGSRGMFDQLVTTTEFLLLQGILFGIQGGKINNFLFWKRNRIGLKNSLQASSGFLCFEETDLERVLVNLCVCECFVSESISVNEHCLNVWVQWTENWKYRFTSICLSVCYLYVLVLFA